MSTKNKALLGIVILLVTILFLLSGVQVNDPLGSTFGPPQ